ncbi:nucleoside-diphosphate-sugar epimerase [Pedobacter cryoconitis]|uniref:Nucleoside-diphosphate-sugar epimerase n=1 Tax=Pedobacter cryoconitis TaxID=188932 RepID=A0A7W8ZJ11_9SPHI|nr:SDR family NAD(P)-dependent oxidoreductase [Pedobacter cryoconitis]MBB5634902.1 nucleoside-diphosphate-sugar epimerase [Pedobacter cryoconitis]MBB6271965.1 nucleoside-diphosphate-sugar epimerase [Pedobacter cryoconitis]
MIPLNKKISILGCGWYGLELARELIKNNYTVKGSTTTPEKLDNLQKAGIIPYLINFSEEKDHFDIEFFNCDILIISIPPKRSSAEQHFFLSKIEKTAKLAADGRIPNIIFISATSVYADDNKEVNELTAPNPQTPSGQAILSAESLLKNIPDFTTTILRFGGLIGPGRDPGKFFAGKQQIPNGKAPVNLIHLSDCIGLTLRIINKQAFGYTFNACAEDHPTRSVFYTAVSLKSGFDKPQFNDELLSWKSVNSIYIAEKLDYKFKVTLNSIILPFLSV